MKSFVDRCVFLFFQNEMSSGWSSGTIAASQHPTIVRRDQSGNFSVSCISASTFSGNLAGNVSGNQTTTAMNNDIVEFIRPVSMPHLTINGTEYPTKQSQYIEKLYPKTLAKRLQHSVQRVIKINDLSRIVLQYIGVLRLPAFGVEIDILKELMSEDQVIVG